MAPERDAWGLLFFMGLSRAKTAEAGLGLRLVFCPRYSRPGAMRNLTGLLALKMEARVVSGAVRYARCDRVSGCFPLSLPA